MNDALADVFDDDVMEEEAENVTSQILAELGVELDTKMVGLDAPRNKLQSMADTKEEQDDMTKEEEDALFDLLPDLKARLDAL